MEEIWKTIKGFSDYDVSNHGRVRSYKDTLYVQCEKPRLLKLKVIKKYVNIGMCLRSKKVYKLVGRLVLTAFSGECPEGMVCRYMDSNPLNNKLDNLKWASRGEVSKNKPLSTMKKLSKEEVRVIRELVNLKLASSKEMSIRFNVSPQVICNLLKGRSYAHVS